MEANSVSDGAIVHSGPARELAADATRVQALAGASAESWSEEDSLPDP